MSKEEAPHRETSSLHRRDRVREDVLVAEGVAQGVQEWQATTVDMILIDIVGVREGVAGFEERRSAAALVKFGGD